jgi:hypothetical protein
MLMHRVSAKNKLSYAQTPDPSAFTELCKGVASETSHVMVLGVGVARVETATKKCVCVWARPLTLPLIMQERRKGKIAHQLNYGKNHTHTPH